MNNEENINTIFDTLSTMRHIYRLSTQHSKMSSCGHSLYTSSVCTCYMHIAHCTRLHRKGSLLPKLLAGKSQHHRTTKRRTLEPPTGSATAVGRPKSRSLSRIAMRGLPRNDQQKSSVFAGEKDAWICLHRIHFPAFQGKAPSVKVKQTFVM